MRSRTKALLLSLPMLALTAFLLAGEGVFASPASVLSYACVLLFVNAMFFGMVYTGETDRYRAAVFITLAVAAAFSFTAFVHDLRGAAGVTEAEIMQGEVPACHIVLPMVLLPAFVAKVVVFPGLVSGGFASIAVLAVFWLAVTLSIGKGFCSWFCFLGGFEDGFARLFRVPLLPRIHPRWRHLPLAVLLTAILTSAYTLTHTYCEWACPFKMVTEFEQVVSPKLFAQAVLFVALFAALVVILPLLTKRRTQCAFFCPLGALQTLTGRIAPFTVRIDPAACSRCGLCIARCPGLSLDDESLRTGKPDASCLLCGTCVDVCPEKAAFFHVRLAPLAGDRELQRVVFLYPAFTFLSCIAGMHIQQALLRLFRAVLPA